MEYLLSNSVHPHELYMRKCPTRLLYRRLLRNRTEDDRYHLRMKGREYLRGRNIYHKSCHRYLSEQQWKMLTDH